MSVICATCSTTNREGAMFCRGCLGKLPAFVATGPAALDLMRSLGQGSTTKSAETPRGAQAPVPTSPFESLAFWLRAAGVALTAIAFIVGWYSWVTRPAPPVGLPASAAAARTVLPAAVAGTAPTQRPMPKVVPASEALGPGEALAPRGPAPVTSSGSPSVASSVTASGPPRLPEAEMQQVFPQQAMQQRRMTTSESSTSTPASNSAATSTSPRSASGDPRAACSGLNFVAAARCEMVQCATAAYSHHPHCNAVREQTRRDVARRNLPN